MIEVFGFNTTKGGTFEMHNTTVEDIKTELHKRFPNWSDAVIDKMIANQSYYKEIIPINDGNKKKVKKGSIAKESIRINDYELNPILSLGQSIHCYKKWGLHRWGSTMMNNVFKNINIASKYEKFDKTYDEVVVAIKNKPKASMSVIKSKVFSMCDSMSELKTAVEKSGILQTFADEYYIKGYTSPGKNASGHKLGLSELMARVGELSGEDEEALK